MKEFLQNLCSVVVAVTIVGGLLYAPFYFFHLRPKEETRVMSTKIVAKIDSLENIINTMVQTDTLLLDRYTDILNKVNLIDGTYVEIAGRVSNVESGLRDLNAELDSYD